MAIHLNIFETGVIGRKPKVAKQGENKIVRSFSITFYFEIERKVIWTNMQTNEEIKYTDKLVFCFCKMYKIYIV